VSSVWGGDYVALYKQALRYGMFQKAKSRPPGARVAPARARQGSFRSVIAGVHSNYPLSRTPAATSAAQQDLLEKYHARFNEYPNFQAEGAYTSPTC